MTVTRINDPMKLIWLAAIIDGEGCFFIHKRKAGTPSYSKFTRADGSEVNYTRTADTFGVGLEICNTSKPIIDRAQAIMGGTVTKQGPGQNRSRKQTIYRLRVAPNEAKRIAQEVYPYLVGKQHQARLIFSCPSSGEAGAAAHRAMMDLHKGIATLVDFLPPPSLELETRARRVLDACCGSRMMWADRTHRDVVFGDIRSETITVTDRSHAEDGTRTLRIEPDALIDFRDLPYPDGSFKLVAFDPPHLVRAGPKSWMAAKYGKLSDNWRDDLRAGFVECFRVLDPDGVLVFKWNETQVKVGEVLALTPVQPLFGHVSGRKGLTHWLIFMPPAQSAEGRAVAGAGK